MSAQDLEPAFADSELAKLAGVDLNLLVPLLALLESASVSRAAHQVGLSQPAVSHALNRLRRQLRDDVLVRQGRGMVLTPKARQLLPRLRSVLQQAAKVVHDVPFDPQTDTRTITVAMSHSTAFVIGAELTRLLAHGAPNTTLRLRTTTVAEPELLTSEAADLVLLTGDLGADYPSEPLFEDRWMLVTHPDTPEDADALELITSQPHVVFDGGGRPMRPYEVLREHRVTYHVRQRVSDYLFIPHLIAQAGGVSFHRYQVALEFRGRFELRNEEFPFPLRDLRVDMVWNPWLAEGGYKSWLREQLIEAARPLNERYQPAAGH